MAKEVTKFIKVTGSERDIWEWGVLNKSHDLDFETLQLPTDDDKRLNGIIEKYQFEALDSGELFNAVDGSDIPEIIREYLKGGSHE